MILLEFESAPLSEDEDEEGCRGRSLRRTVVLCVCVYVGGGAVAVQSQYEFHDSPAARQHADRRHRLAAGAADADQDTPSLLRLQRHRGRPAACDIALFSSLKQCPLTYCLQCFDAVCWAAGRTSALKKTEWWGAGMVICLE